jgi:hypothetical protein
MVATAQFINYGNTARSIDKLANELAVVQPQCVNVGEKWV